MNGSDELVLITVLPITILFWVWVVWAILQWRKMRHQSKLQEKIVDKFSSVPELNDFLQSEGGSKFLKSIRFEGLGPREKILSSLSKGVIFALLGVALVIIAQLFTEEMKYFAMFGIVAVAVGIGFLVSTFISYKLSKKWGIFNNNF